MGELADKLIELSERTHGINEINALFNAVAKLESDFADVSGRNAELAHIATQAIDGWESLWSSDYDDRPPTELVKLRVRLERTPASTDYVHVRDRDALLQVATLIVERGHRVVGMAKIKPKEMNGEKVVSLRLGGYISQATDAVAVVMVPSHTADPDLLERASTLLAEAYIAAKKEGQ